MAEPSWADRSLPISGPHSRIRGDPTGTLSGQEFYDRYHDAISTAVLSGDLLGSIIFRGWDTAAMSEGIRLDAAATANWGAAAHAVKLNTYLAGNNLLSLDSASGNLTLPGIASTPVSIVLGTITGGSKMRIETNNASPAGGWLALTTNRDPATGTQDDATKASWQFILRSDQDNMSIGRSPVGSTALVSLLALDNAGSLTLAGVDGGATLAAVYGYGQLMGGSFYCNQARGTHAAPSASLNNDLLGQVVAQGWGTAFGVGGILRFFAAENWSGTAHGTSAYIYVTPLGSTTNSSSLAIDPSGSIFITGAVGQKSSGTTWSNPSDIRLKTDVRPYERGLADVIQLDPISYTLKASGAETCGFDAAAVQKVFPECIGTTRGMLDDVETDLLTLDMHGILVAMVNAIKELARRGAP